MVEQDKIVCKECGWKGTTEEVLEGKHPFLDGYKVYGCPQCKEVEPFRCACDKEGCWNEDTCGTPTRNGYRRTCHVHVPKERDE